MFFIMHVNLLPEDALHGHAPDGIFIELVEPREYVPLFSVFTELHADVPDAGKHDSTVNVLTLSWSPSCWPRAQVVWSERVADLSEVCQCPIHRALRGDDGGTHAACGQRAHGRGGGSGGRGRGRRPRGRGTAALASRRVPTEDDIRRKACFETRLIRSKGSAHAMAKQEAKEDSCC